MRHLPWQWDRCHVAVWALVSLEMCSHVAGSEVHVSCVQVRFLVYPSLMDLNFSTQDEAVAVRSEVD